jgi:predicted RNase H-like HicB family nuclease
MTVRYVCGQEKDYWLGYLEQYPDYWTQGESLEDLKQHLKDLYEDLSNERIPEARRVAELEIS